MTPSFTRGTLPPVLLSPLALADVISIRNAVWMEGGNGDIANFLKGGAISPVRGIFGT